MNGLEAHEDHASSRTFLRAMHGQGPGLESLTNGSRSELKCGEALGSIVQKNCVVEGWVKEQISC
jgi:hypothetical protein